LVTLVTLHLVRQVAFAEYGEGGIPTASYPPFPPGYLFDIAFNNHEYKAYCHELWAYDQHTPAGEQKHFAIETCRGQS
jgi:hypothetical protein